MMIKGQRKIMITPVTDGFVIELLEAYTDSTLQCHVTNTSTAAAKQVKRLLDSREVEFVPPRRSTDAML